jgi:ParB-like chromosome segregation protein Spo0J
MSELRINNAFRALIPPLTKDELERLTESCLSEGIRDALCVWNGTIIDGHNRYKIAQDHNLSFEVRELEFSDEYAAKEWMIINQLGRRNLTKEQKDYLIGQRYNNEKASHGGDRDQGSSAQNGHLGVDPKTRQRLAREYGVGTGTISRNSDFAKGVDKMEPELKHRVLSGKSTLGKQDVQQIAKAEPFFKAQSEKDIIQKAKELREQRKQEYKAKLAKRIEEKAKAPLSIEEAAILEKLKKGETVVININTHFAVLKYAKDNGLYQQIDRYSEWGNPFVLNIDGDRDHVCDAFARYYQDKQSLHSKIKTLKGKALGCHCHPLRCHGDELKKLCDEN